MPTTAQFAFTGARLDPAFNADDAIASLRPVAFGANLNLAQGTVVGKITATGKYIAYASASADGSQVPVGITQYPVVTDAGGNITNFNEWGGTDQNAPIFLTGAFNLADLTGLDDNAVTKLSGHVDGNGVANASVFLF